jgi:serine/threonine protein kinase
LDAAVEKAVKNLIRKGKYIGKIIQNNGGNDDGLICVEEIPTNATYGIPEYIVQLPTYTEKHCRKIFRQIVSIIKLCHDNGLAHRNLLLTSLLVNKTVSFVIVMDVTFLFYTLADSFLIIYTLCQKLDDRNNIILRGLQYAQAIVIDQPLTGHFGYLYSWYAFKAPEIDSELFHEKTVDNWSLGAALYMLLTALPPFRGDGVELITNKHCGNVVFDTVVPSIASQKLVRALLQPNPQKRMTIEQVLAAEWMTESDEILAKHDLGLTQALLQDF